MNKSLTLANQTKDVSIILIEDDDIDAESVTRAVKKLNIGNPVYRAYDGIEALNMMEGNNSDSEVKKPYIILLDINLPRMNGIEFLEIIRKNEQIKDSVVFILTTSKAEEDIVAAHQHNVTGYIVKTEIESGFLEILKMIQNYWKIVELPA